MRRFLDSRTYSPSNWPDEYKKDFLSVLEQFHYKGSLVQTFETDKIKSITALPPITENVFNLDQATELNAIADSQYPNNHYNVVLHDSVNIILVNGIVLGSTNGRHSNSSSVFVKTSPNTSTLCEIHFFFLLGASL